MCVGKTVHEYYTCSAMAVVAKQISSIPSNAVIWTYTIHCRYATYVCVYNTCYRWRER